MLRTLFIITALGLLGGCTQMVQETPGTRMSWEQHRQRISEISSWTLDGRVSIRSGDEAWSGSLRWQQDGDRYDLVINAPLGAGSLQLKGNPDFVVLRHSNQETPYTSSNPEKLLQQQLGWHVPVDSLRYWVVGLPDPQRKPAEQVKIDEYGRLAQMQQAGWDIRFLRYLKVRDLQLPGKVFLDNKDQGIRMVISSWELKP